MLRSRLIVLELETDLVGDGGFIIGAHQEGLEKGGRRRRDVVAVRGVPGSCQ